ncbi:MAG: nucleotide sugar dehydrogenase, partial [Pseudomonas sp.]
VEVAEMIKYTCNVWHATKVSFANEIGNIAKASGVDGREVMDVVCQDYKLNLSRYYLRPGFAFGGSCLPKDVRALTYRAGQLDVEHPLLASIMDSNRNQVRNAFELIARQDKRRIALLGLSFKAGTDDLRESPLVELAEMLIGKGFELSIYDSNVEYARVFGANRDYIESKIPHVSSLLCSDLEQVIREADVIVLGNNDERFALALEASTDKQVIDLVGFMPHGSTAHQQGICW